MLVRCFVVAAILVTGWMSPTMSWAAAAHRSDSATTYASRTNTTLTAPAGIQDGDVLVIVFCIGANPSAPTPTPPAGFSAPTGTWPITITDLSGFNVKTFVWYKVASGESGNYTVTHTSAASQGYIGAYNGGTSAQPAATTNTGTTATSTALSITPSANGSVVIFAAHDWGDTTNALSPPTGSTPTFSERLDPGTVSGILYVADGVLATAGATGNKSHTNNTAVGGGHGWAASLIVVEASGGGSPPPPPSRMLMGVGK